MTCNVVHHRYGSCHFIWFGTCCTTRPVSSSSVTSAGCAEWEWNIQGLLYLYDIVCTRNPFVFIIMVIVYSLDQDAH